MVTVNDFAQDLSKREGGAVNLPIAQIMEVVRHFREMILECSGVDNYSIIRKCYTPEDEKTEGGG